MRVVDYKLDGVEGKLAIEIPGINNKVFEARPRCKVCKIAKELVLAKLQESNPDVNAEQIEIIRVR
jgi:hypothetical protein